MLATTRPLALTAMGGIVLLALAPLSAQALPSQGGPPVALEVPEPRVTSAWEVLDDSRQEWAPRHNGASAEIMKTYTAGERRVSLYVAYYPHAVETVQLFRPDTGIAVGEQWTRLAEGSREVVQDGHAGRAYETVLRSRQGTSVVWHWYWISGELTSSLFYGKLLQVRHRLFGGPEGAAFIAMATPEQGALSDAITTLQDFLRDFALKATLKDFSTPPPPDSDLVQK